MGFLESQLILVAWQLTTLVFTFTRWCHHQKRLPMFCRPCVNYPILPQVILTLTRPACLMAFACWDFLTSLMLWAWRHQLPPASDLILTTHTIIELFIFCQGRIIRVSPPDTGCSLVTGPGPVMGAGHHVSWGCHEHDNIVTTWHRDDIRQPATLPSQCFGGTEENCKLVITDC